MRQWPRDLLVPSEGLVGSAAVSVELSTGLSLPAGATGSVAEASFGAAAVCSTFGDAGDLSDILSR